MILIARSRIIGLTSYPHAFPLDLTPEAVSAALQCFQAADHLPGDWEEIMFGDIPPLRLREYFSLERFFPDPGKNTQETRLIEAWPRGDPHTIDEFNPNVISRFVVHRDGRSHWKIIDPGVGHCNPEFRDRYHPTNQVHGLRREEWQKLLPPQLALF